MSKNLLVFMAGAAVLNSKESTPPAPINTAIRTGGGSSSIRAYTFDDSGFVSQIRRPDPLPPNLTNEVIISPNESAVIVCMDSSSDETAYAYKWGEDGFGDKYPAPAYDMGAIARGCSFTQDGNYIILCTLDGNRIIEWDDVTGWGSIVETIPGPRADNHATNSASDVIFRSSSSSPYIFAYPWNPPTLGAAYPSPGTPPPGQSLNVRLSPNESVVAVGHSGPGIAAYPWDDSTGFGTKYAEPSPLPAGTVEDFTWNRAGTVVACITKTSPFVHAYAWDDVNGFGAEFSAPSSLITSDPSTSGEESGIAFNHDDNLLVVGDEIYAWDNSTGFGVKLEKAPYSSNAGTVLSSVGPNPTETEGEWSTDMSNLFTDLEGDTQVTSSGDPVGYMKDQNTVFRSHMIADSTTDRPTFRGGGETLPHLEFDGVDGALRATLPSKLNVEDSGFTFGFAGRIRTTSSANEYMMVLSTESATTPYIAIRTTNGGFGVAFVDDTNTVQVATQAIPADTSNHVFVLRLTGTTAEFWLDGVLEESHTVAGSYPIDVVTIGARTRGTIIDAHSDADIYDSFFVAKGLSNTEREDKEDELASSAGITLGSPPPF